MNNQQFKLSVFGYFLYKLSKEIQNKEKYLSLIDSLRNLNTARIMLLWYLTCLESISDEELGLFKYFAEFRSWTIGIIDTNIYYILDKVPGFKYIDCQFVDIDINNVYIPTDNIKNLIDTSVNNLIQHLPKYIFNNRNKLSEIHRSFSLYRDTFLYVANHKVDVNSESLRQNLKEYRDLIQLL